MPGNPYVVGPPLRGSQGFYGRQDILAWVSAELSNPPTNALVLLGQRRIGKTSLLWQLQAGLSRDYFLPVYFDLQDQATRPLSAVLSDLADTLAEAIGLELATAPVIDERGRAFARDFLPQVYAALPTDVRPVFLLDEFDVLDKAAEAELPENSAARAFFPFLRSLMSAEPRLAFVFVVGRRADDLSLNFMSTFRASLQREVWVLDRASAEALIRQGEGPEGLRLAPEAVERILSLTAGHPYLIQLVCQRLWQAYAGGDPITVAQVEATTGEALEMGGQALVWLWDGLAPAEKIYAAALAESAAEGQTIGEDQVIRVITQHSARLRTREVELAPTDLVKRRVLERAEGRVYRFAVELFRRWVRANKSLASVKDEIDRVDALADRYFQIGLELFNRRDWSGAQEEFRRALARNERHFRARLYLGEGLLELGQTAAAVTELEAAYKLDEVEARLPLVRGWLRLAQEQQQAGQAEAALHTYARILHLSPTEAAALAGQAQIWQQRGEAALARQDYAAALEAFEKAGRPQQMEETRRRQKLAALATLAVQAEGHVARQSWGEALTVYQQLVALAPEEGRWQAEMARVQTELRLSEQYAEAQGYMQQQAWDKAQQTLVSVLGLRPDYRDTAELLVQVKGQQSGRRPARLERLSPRGWAAVAAGLCLLALLGGLGWLRSAAEKRALTGQAQSTAAAVSAAQTESHDAATLAAGTIRALGDALATLTITPSPTPTLTPRPSPTPTLTPVATDSPTPAVTPTPSRVLTPTSTATLIPTQESRRASDGAVMVQVPAGSFMMGSTDADPDAYSDEQPAHEVTLDAFQIDKYEVTNAQYAQCVEAGLCEPSVRVDDPDFNGAMQPVVDVSWQDAADYCAWAGARLPTEAEWEYAARGPDSLVYPWGNEFDGSRLNFCDANCSYDWKDGSVDDGYALTAPVGSYPQGASWVGALDMAGNVWEWVNDWYQSDYYTLAVSDNPPGPTEAESDGTKVLRGGAWYNLRNNVRCALRGRNAPHDRDYFVGFRCASTSS